VQNTRGFTGGGTEPLGASPIGGGKKEPDANRRFKRGGAAASRAFEKETPTSLGKPLTLVPRLIGRSLPPVPKFNPYPWENLFTSNFHLPCLSRGSIFGGLFFEFSRFLKLLGKKNGNSPKKGTACSINVEKSSRGRQSSLQHHEEGGGEGERCSKGDLHLEGAE